MEEGLHRRDRENCSSLITNSLADIESSLQRDAEAAYTHAEVRPPKRVARLELAAAVQTSPEGVSWMWTPAGHRPGVIFFSAWPTPFPCLQLQPASLGTDQLPPGCRREQEQAAAPWASPPPPFPWGCWFSRSAAAVLLGKSDVIAGPAGKRWETRSL